MNWHRREIIEQVMLGLAFLAFVAGCFVTSKAGLLALLGFGCICIALSEARHKTKREDHDHYHR